MELVALIVFIEKGGDSYSAYSANLPGVTVTGLTREEVEREMLSRIETYMTDLSERHQRASSLISMAPGPLEEKIRCVGTAAPHWSRPSPGPCEMKANKDGLCWRHWRDLYGHAVDMYHTTRCDVCGETDSNMLRHWDVPCPGKIQNPQWRIQIQELRESAQALELAQRREKKILEKIKQAESESISRPTASKKKLPPPPTPHDAISRADFLRLSGLTSSQLNKLLRQGEVEGVSIVGRMFFSRRQLERLIKT